MYSEVDENIVGGGKIATDKTPITADKIIMELNWLSADETKVIEYLRHNEFITNKIVQELINKKIQQRKPYYGA